MFSNCSDFASKTRQNLFAYRDAVVLCSVSSAHTETLENADVCKERSQPSLVQPMWRHYLANVFVGRSLIELVYDENEYFYIALVWMVTQKHIRMDAFSNKNLLESTGPELFTMSRKMGHSELSTSYFSST